MAFIVETGDIVPGANSYVSVDFADAYHSDRGNESWSDLTTEEKQSALIKATDYLEQVYEGRWVGYQEKYTQPLSWPRGYYDARSYFPIIDQLNIDPSIYGVIPERLKQAACILALESVSGDLNPLQDREVKKEKVDVIEVEYMDNARSRPSRPAIDGLLRKLVSGSALNSRVVRV